MASHVRTQIRNAVVDLVTNLTTTEHRVYKSRNYPLDSSEIPGLCVYVNEEELDEEEGKLARIQFRSLMIAIDGYDAVVAGLDDNLDTIAAEVETAVFADRFLGGLVKALDLLSVKIAENVEASKPIGMVRLTFMAQYLTDEGAPTIAL